MAKVQLEERNHQKKPRVFLLILMEPSNVTRYAPFSQKVDKCWIKNNSIILFSNSTGLIKNYTNGRLTTITYYKDVHRL